MTKQLTVLYEFLIDRFQVKTIVLFGSTARGEQTSTSDIDLLLITEKKIKRREVLKAIPDTLYPKRKLGLSTYSADQVNSAYRKGSLFMAHLLKEGKVAYDDGFFKRLSSKPFILSTSRMRLSLKIFDERVKLTNDLRIYDKHFVRVLSDFYAMAKNIAFILLAYEGDLIFNRKKAFAMLSERYPSHKETIENLQELEPFYIRTHRGAIERYPLPPSYSEEKVAQLRLELKELITLGEKEIAC